jgi:metal-responsive CopG/Arc/MetJ family transcriptional regulator
MKKTKIASYSLPADVVKYTSDIAKSENKSRSEVVCEALESYRVFKEWGELQAYGSRRAKSVGIKDEKDVERVIHEFRKK